MVHMLAGFCLMLAAMLADPDARSSRWAAVWLVGAALFIAGVA